MTPKFSNFVPLLLIETDKYIEVADGNYVTEKQTGQVQISIHDDNGQLLISTLYNFLSDSDLCDRLFSIIVLMNLGHTCLFHKVFCTFFFGDNEQNVVTITHNAQINVNFC